MKHSKVLEDTTLWKVYNRIIPENTERNVWIKKVYETAVVYLKDVRQTFINYTMHDETHVLNVLDAMGGLLGDCISNLTEGEIELLILAASLHDLGMVYTDEEKELCFENEAVYTAFLKEYCPEFLGSEPKDWTEDTRQWYLRTLHPFRLSEALQNKEWKEIFDNRPIEIVPVRCILAVCQAHGEEPKIIRNNKNLEYLAASNIDPLFCALLLRLADLLDFDDTRAPKVLYSYAECNDRSREEWDKHQASAGFRYPDSPSVDELPYKACCKNPMIEHAVRDFLDWIDDELGNCIRLQRYCNKEWQKEFPFPRAVLRKEIESDGYMSGDFCLTMDQTQIMNLLMGENLYDNRDVFVRELLQNSIDATLLRGEMDINFVPEKSHIDLWDWSDKEGNFWFRIDDYGTGMTLGMLNRYFLKVGNSYYTSRELERDLRSYGKTKSYQGISRFGIGFLSCFLCGDYVEVSTLYFNSEKNQREESTSEPSRMVNYGLRLQVTGLTGYYTLKSQAEKHQVDSQLPVPDFYDAGIQGWFERHGYRSKPGTSIVIRLNPGKLGTLNLRESVENYLCGSRVPVYYNNKRVGRTYEEMMETAHKMSGEKIYELTPELKKKFDDCFPFVQGQYPKLAVTIVPLDTEEENILPDFSGVIIKYNLCFEHTPQGKIKDQNYEVEGRIGCSHGIPEIKLSNKNMKFRYPSWTDLEFQYDQEEICGLKKKLETFESCPSEEQLGEPWLPFSGDLDLHTVWIAYCDFFYKKEMSFYITECECPNLSILFGFTHIPTITYAYQGIKAYGEYIHFNNSDVACNVIILLEGEWRPSVEISRTKILSLPLKILVTISSILTKYELWAKVNRSINHLWNCERVSLSEWRGIVDSTLGQWVNKTQEDLHNELKKAYQESGNIKINTFILLNNKQILTEYFKAYFQDNYSMTVNYEEGDFITFYEKKKDGCRGIFDIFPPMMFCKAASDQSRKYICHANSYCRKGITVDHPFIIWLLENSVKMNQYFHRQFEQIIFCLCDKDADNIIKEINIIHQQLLSLTDWHGVDINSLPQLSLDDFWVEEKEMPPF